MYFIRKKKGTKAVKKPREKRLEKRPSPFIVSALGSLLPADRLHRKG